MQDFNENDIRELCLIAQGVMETHLYRALDPSKTYNEHLTAKLKNHIDFILPHFHPSTLTINPKEDTSKMSFLMPAGAYWIGDLCYVMHPQWDEFCDKAGDIRYGSITLDNGTRVAFLSTAYGDGSYYHNYNKGPQTLAVDSGLIGCIRIEDISCSELANLHDGIIVNFTSEFQVQVDPKEPGLLRFGHIEVYTDHDPDGDEDDDYEYEDRDFYDL